MSSNTDKNLVLCEVCTNFRDVDKLISPEGFKHHSSYTALCKAAGNGCNLCQSFMRAQRLNDREVLEPNFDEDIDASKTQITWKRHSQGCLFILCQDALLRANECFNVWFEVYVEGDDPLASILSGRPIQTTSNSETCDDLVSCWMSKCRSEHPFCPRDEDRALPSRVIDVGSDSRDPFLYITEGQRGQWATLSHCWGNDTLTITTKNTVRQREMSIPLKDLQPTFQDAILITRKLGFQYLWIDSLCIIQDSLEDWARESAQMHEIYARASINISATAAHSSQDGIFNSSDKDRCYTKPLVQLPSYSNGLKVGGSLSIRTQTGKYPMVWVTDQPLHKRAWVLQESALSPCRIDFSSEQLYWSCRTSTFTEGDPHVPRIQDWDLNQKALFQMPLGDIPPQLDQEMVVNKSPISWWYTTLSLYYRRSLTFAKDNLPAIAGIAIKVKERTGYNYKAGLWLEDFHRALLWQPDRTMKRLENTSVPSWSWASTKFPWTWRRLHLDIYLPDFRATVLEVSIDTLEDDPFGPVTSGSLRIEGGCKGFENWQIGTNIIYNTSPCSMRLFNRWLDPEVAAGWWNTVPPPGRVICTLDESLPDEVREPKYETETHSGLIQRKVICLQIAKFGHNRFWHLIKTDEEIATVFALILEPTGQGVDEYKRIGIAEIPEDHGMAEGWDRRVVTIV